MNRLFIRLAIVLFIAPATLSLAASDMLLYGGGAGEKPSNTLNPQIVGLDFPVSPSASLTLTADVGRWDNTPTSYAYNWHFVSGGSLGTASTLTLDPTADPTIIGKAVEVDVTATNSAGSTTLTSHWFGPIETSAPAAPVEYETLGTTGSTTLPTEPAHFLQNGHAVFPGCAIPPVSPNTDPAHVWYFDPINGRTKDAGATGHAGSPFKDASAIFNSVRGYTGGKLFGGAIPPGDTIYIEPGDSSHPIGDIASTTGNYSTSDGTTTGAVEWTWIMADPAATSRPVLHKILIQNGGAGFVFKGLNVEQYRENRTYPVAVSGTIVAPARDIHLEDIHVSTWLGHSEDPWLPSHYPDSGGTSDGTIVTASPVLSAAAPQDPPNEIAIAAANSTSIALNAIPPMGYYIWSPGYYRSEAVTNPASSGIPNGSKVSAINGVATSPYGPLSYRNFITAMTASEITALTLRGTVKSAAALNSIIEDDTGYYIVQANTTAVQSVFTWNTSRAKWASIGTFLPSTSAVTDALFQTANRHVIHWTGSAWEDLGTPVATIAPCDPVVDAATGCPTTNYPGSTTNVPGCDPRPSQTTGGCPAGSVPAWNGATRAITGEHVTFTDMLAIVPAGYWNSVDWDGMASSGFRFSGGLDRANSIDPANPNLLKGASCLSAKDSIVRDEYNGFQMANVKNSVIYNNKVKWTSADDFDAYSNHRVWYIHNYGSDPTLIWAHQDGIQFGDTNGRQDIKYYYNNAAIENELYEATDPTNFFPRPMQGINTTENNHWGMYVCCNIVNVQNNGIGISGKYNVVAHNDMLGQAIVVGNQKKPVALTTPTFDLLANNIGNGISRTNNVPSFCDPAPGDGNTVESNLSIPFLPLGSAANSGVVCPIGEGAGQFTAAPGNYIGQTNWTQTDWRSGATGISSLFTAYHPLDPPVQAAPGWGQNYTTPIMSTCVQNSFTPTGNCAPGSNGIINLRPNTGFAGTTVAIVATVRFPLNLPASQPEGTYGLAQQLFRTRAGDHPPGLWKYCKACPGHFSDLPGWVFVTADFNPGIIGKGTNLGAQQPIADHDGKAWNNPPSIGAYEQ